MPCMDTVTETSENFLGQRVRLLLGSFYCWLRTYLFRFVKLVTVFPSNCQLSSFPFSLFPWLLSPLFPHCGYSRGWEEMAGAIEANTCVQPAIFGSCFHFTDFICSDLLEQEFND